MKKILKVGFTEIQKAKFGESLKKPPAIKSDISKTKTKEQFKKASIVLKKDKEKKTSKPAFSKPTKTKKKPYYEEQADAIAKSMQAKIEDFEDYEFGKIIDWGDIDTGGIVDKLMIVLEELCGIRLFPYQSPLAWRIIESIILNDGDEITALIARQSGKSEVLADVACTLMTMLPILGNYFSQLRQYKDGFWIGIFAPRQEQADTIGHRIDTRMTGENAMGFLSDPEVGIDYKDYKLSNGSFCRVHSAAPQSKLESKTYHLIFVDEASDVEESKIISSIHPMGAATSATIVKIGTPKPYKSEFFDAIQRNKQLELGTRGKVKNHFEYDYKIVMKYNQRYEKFIQKEINRYGKESDFFRMNYGLEWLLEKGMAVTPDTFNEKMRNQKDKFQFEGVDNCIYVAGLDLGKKFDSTVLTMLELTKKKDFKNYDTDDFQEDDGYDKRILNWYEYEGEDWEQQIKEVVGVMREFPQTQTLVIDATGVGDMPAEVLTRKLMHFDVEVVIVIYSAKKKDELAKIFYRNLNFSSIRVPCHNNARGTKRWRKFYTQLLSAEKTWHNGLMRVQHPKQKGSKDDYVQSLMLALYGAAHFLNKGAVTSGENLFYQPEMEDDRSGVVEHSVFSHGQVQGFEKIRKLAREGRLTVQKASFDAYRKYSN